MKVLQINSVCGIGSTGRIVTDIDEMLKEKGHDSYVAFGRYGAVNSSTPIKIGNTLDNYSHVAKTRLFDRHGFGSANATRKFITQIEALDPDIIHLHNIHGYFINIKILFEYIKQNNKPVIWTLHDCWAFTGHCSHFDYVGCNRWKTRCYQCPQTREYPSSLLIDNSENNYRDKKQIFMGVNNLTIVTPSNWLAGLVRESFLGEYPVEVINNGIDLSVFKPVDSRRFKRTNNLENKFIILGVANIWSDRKGFKYFIELSKSLKEDEVIVLVGVTEKQNEKLPKNIIGIPRTDKINELAEIYSAADVFVNPTLEDNFPTTNLEALGCGTPVITFNTGGSVESIDANTGISIEQGNMTLLKESLEEIKVKGKSFFSTRCILSVKEQYNKIHMYGKYLNLYKSCFF